MAMIIFIIILIIATLYFIKICEESPQNANTCEETNSKKSKERSVENKTEYSASTEAAAETEKSDITTDFTETEDVFDKEEYLSKIICLDTETTGLHAGRDEILQLSIIDGNGKVLFDELVKPAHRKKWVEAQEINGITPEIVKNKLPLSAYDDKLSGIFRNALKIVGYNLEFDLKFLEKSDINASEYIYPENCVDVMKEFAPIYGHVDRNHGDFKFKRLKTCARYYKYSWEGDAHNALEDAKATMHCYLVMHGFKEKPAHIKMKKSDKPLSQNVWKEFKKNKTGEMITVEHLNEIIDLFKKWIEECDGNKYKISCNLSRHEDTLQLYYGGYHLLEIRMLKTMNYIKIYSGMKGITGTDNTDKLYFYDISDLEENSNLKNYVSKAVESFSGINN